ncbi:uncharacterized protein LOC122069223 [Macadamia integrifolia]|uniref:uncharacterized protein LOC122069223 n=1 Tax=Macadamia integrifolia TaxID=60698 RepID=UPI001C4EE327|nr:uncharacterized protein LOC122069223 [Macadamia integrifolia]
MPPFEEQYDRKCWTPLSWDEVGERHILGTDFIQVTSEKVNMIRERIKAAQFRQKSYADVRRRRLEFGVGDKLFLRISPIKGIMQFGKKGKLSLRKYIPGPTHVLTYIPHEFDEDYAYVEYPEKIFDRKDHLLRNRIVSFVKVKWMNHPEQKASWEQEEEMKK